MSINNNQLMIKSDPYFSFGEIKNKNYSHLFSLSILNVFLKTWVKFVDCKYTKLNRLTVDYILFYFIKTIIKRLLIILTFKENKICLKPAHNISPRSLRKWPETTDFQEAELTTTPPGPLPVNDCLDYEKNNQIKFTRK